MAGIGDRIADGTATPEEAEQLIGLERTVMLYDLMMGGVLERHGTWHTEKNKITAGGELPELISRIAALENLDTKILADALSWAAENDNLSLERVNGEVWWRWRNYLL